MCQSGCINENYWGDCTLRECELQVEEMLKRKKKEKNNGLFKR